MRTIARCFLLFGLVAVVPRVAAAQATLAGEVKDTTGAVLPGVTVEAASPALIEKVRTAVTDGSGRYRIESLPPGSYTVTFSLTGFAPVKREDLIVSGSGVITVDVELTVGGMAETITVTPRRRDESSLDVPGAINAFTAADIKTAGIDRPQDFVALTPNMSLVQTQNQGTSFVTVRGISQARNSEPSVAVLIDGVQMANPSQFNQELFDIDTIQVLKGPQGALYGRNAIGGAIIINTKKPSDVFEGNVTLGADSGPGINVRGSMSGPISNTLKYIASGSYFDTKGYIRNVFLNENADPFRDVSGRLRFVWEPSKELSADVRVYASGVRTQALYFNITESVNDTSLPVRVNNAGVNERNMFGTSLKLDYVRPLGTLTSITAYDRFNELLTGDQFNFLPIQESVLFKFFGADQAQHQFLDVNAVSEALQFASPATKRVRWIAGAYAISTDRFISTGNVFDLGTGVVPEVRRHPLPLFNPQFTYLADSQDNFAWAVFGNVDVNLTDKLELSTALRYDRDDRKNTTETPAEFIPAPLVGIAFPGQVRTHTWDDCAAESHVAPQADTRFHAVYRLQPRLPQRRLQSNGCRCSGHCRCERLVRRRDGGYLRSGRQGRISRPARRRQPQHLPHEGERILLLRVRSEHEHAESGESRSRRLHGRGVRSAGTHPRRIRRLCRARLHRQRHQGVQARRE